MNPWTALAFAVVEPSGLNLTSVLSVAIPSAIAVVGVVLSALWLRRSSQESNKNVAKQGETSAFEVVTNQLFRINEELTERLEKVEGTVARLEGEVAVKEAENVNLRDQVREANTVTRSLANYIRQLISAWPANSGPPPTPDPPIDWKRHL